MSDSIHLRLVHCVLLSKEAQKSKIIKQSACFSGSALL